MTMYVDPSCRTSDGHSHVVCTHCGSAEYYAYSGLFAYELHLGLHGVYTYLTVCIYTCIVMCACHEHEARFSLHTNITSTPTQTCWAELTLLLRSRRQSQNNGRPVRVPGCIARAAEIRPAVFVHCADSEALTRV